MELSNCTKTTLVALLAIIVCQQPGLADSYMRNLGEQYFKAGQYQDAANILAIASSETPKDAYVHYLRASALAKLRQNAEAAGEYRMCVALDHGGVIGKYSQQALASLDPQKSKPKPKPSAQANAEADELARQRLTAECDAMVDRINKETDDKVKALEKERQAQIAVNAPNSIHNSPAANDAINKEYKGQTEALRAEEMSRVAAASAYYARKLSALKGPER
jgi:hypothetical protein